MVNKKPTRPTGFTENYARSIFCTLSDADRIRVVREGIGTIDIHFPASMHTLTKIQVMCEAWMVTQRRNVY